MNAVMTLTEGNYRVEWVEMGESELRESTNSQAHFTVIHDGLKGWTITRPGHTPSAWFSTEAEAAYQCANANEVLDSVNASTWLRFSCFTFVDGEWEPMTDASYCTSMPADTDNFTLFLALKHIMATIYGKDNVKKECEKLSWISPDWFDAF